MRAINFTIDKLDLFESRITIHHPPKKFWFWVWREPFKEFFFVSYPFVYEYNVVDAKDRALRDPELKAWVIARVKEHNELQRRVRD